MLEQENSLISSDRTAGEEGISTHSFLEAFGEPALLIQHPERQIIGVNRALEAVFGYDERALVGQSTRILHASEEAYTLFARLGELSGGRQSAFQTRYWLKCRDGRILTTENHVTPVLIAGRDMYLSLIHVTEDPVWFGVLEAVRKLTHRERSILACLLTGMSGKEVARVVDISPRTVEKHRDHILEKFTVSTTGQLLARFLPGELPVIDMTLKEV